jgi:glycine hydroxymethyltransferase
MNLTNFMNLTNLLQAELERQQNSLELIASENYTSPAVIASYSNVFTNKYSEWYPWARYYGGNEIVDDLELYTQSLGLQIFWLNPQVWWVNVQPLSGSVANLAVYTWVLEAWDTILAMDLSAWWHLTHGMKLNASGKYFNIISYGVKADGTIDYDQVRSLALEYKPTMIVVWFSSYPRSIDRDLFNSVKQELQTQHNHHTFLMADIAHIAGLVAGWVIDGPFGHGFDIVTTTTHKTLRWPRWALIYYNHANWKSEKTLKNGTIKITTLKDLINRGVFPGVQGGPFDHVLVAKATSFLEILDPATDWSWYCSQVLKNAKTLAAWLVARWWSVATWDTENHIVILDVTAKNLPSWEGGVGGGLTGKIAEKLLEDIWLSVNKQLIPNDPRPPLDPSWVRLGTPAITTRGLKEADIETLVDIIDTILTQWESTIPSQKARVLELCQKYPLPY